MRLSSGARFHDLKSHDNLMASIIFKNISLCTLECDRPSKSSRMAPFERPARHCLEALFPAWRISGLAGIFWRPIVAI